MLSLFCGNRYPPLSSGSPLPLAQFAEPFLIKRFRSTDNRSDSEPIFYRHRVGTIIDIPSESLSASDRNPYRHRPESAVGWWQRTPGRALAVFPDSCEVRKSPGRSIPDRSSSPDVELSEYPDQLDARRQIPFLQERNQAAHHGLIDGKWRRKAGACTPEGLWGTFCLRAASLCWSMIRNRRRSFTRCEEGAHAPSRYRRNSARLPSMRMKVLCLCAT